jgi:hypothetical protein
LADKNVRSSSHPAYHPDLCNNINDVAWSASSILFKDISSLLDIRKGRGFYNSFNSTSFIMKRPLDHFFISEEFRLVEVKTGGNIDSDHFPFYISLSLEPEKAAEQKTEGPTKDQIKKRKEGE